MRKIEPETWKYRTTDSDQRGVGRGMMGKRRGRVKSRNMYDGPMDKDNTGSIDYGRGGGLGRGEQCGGNEDNCN